MDGGIRTHDPKKTWSVDDALRQDIINSGVLIVRLTTCKR